MHTYDKRNYVLLPHAIMNIVRIVYQLYNTDNYARVRHHAPPTAGLLGFVLFLTTLANPLYDGITCATIAYTGS